VGAPAARQNGEIAAPPVIAGLARANKNDIDKAWEAVKGAVRPRIHTFLATSDIHMEHKLRMTRDEVLERVGDMVQYARSLCADVEFSPKTAGAATPSFWSRCWRGDPGRRHHAEHPDTVGYTTPEEYGGLIRYLRETHPGGKDVIFSCHCHNDLGLATANTLAGCAEWRAPDRGDDQRHRRARRQHQPGRNGHGLHVRPQVSTWTPTSSHRRFTAPATWSAATPAW
jgi:isopropylmalate/homocitrate/citramalate synthase